MHDPPRAPGSPGTEVPSRETSLRRSLKELYAQGRYSHRDAARLEKELWDIVKKRYKRAGFSVEKQKWFQEQLGVKGHIVRARSALISAGELAVPAWEAIDDGAVALEVAYRAVNSSKAKSDPARYVRKVFRDLREKRRKPTDFRPGYKKRNRKRSSVEEPGGAPADALETTEILDAKAFQERVAVMARAFVEDRVLDTEDGTIEEMVEDFEYSVRVAADDLLVAVKTVRRRGDNQVRTVKASEIRRAFEYLGLDPPKKLTREAKETARRMYRLVSRDLHPDRNNNDPKITEQFREVQKAWNIIRDAEVKGD